MNTPTPDEVKAARLAAGLSQAAAAELVGFSRVMSWSDIERGKHPMTPGLFELFRIKTGAHPAYRAIKGAAA